MPLQMFAKTKSERISDTVFFKHTYLTQPTVIPADSIVKALRDLTQALKGRTNMGIEKIESLTKINKFLNNIPTINKIPTRKVIVDGATKPPPEVQAAPRVNNMSKLVKERTMINTAIINKPLTIKTPPTRVETSTNETPIFDVPPPRVVETPKVDRKNHVIPKSSQTWKTHSKLSKQQSKSPSPSPNDIAQ